MTEAAMTITAASASAGPRGLRGLVRNCARTTAHPAKSKIATAAASATDRNEMALVATLTGNSRCKESNGPLPPPGKSSVLVTGLSTLTQPFELHCSPFEFVVWNVTLKGAGVPAVTSITRVETKGRVGVEPAEMPQTVGCAVVPVGDAGRLVGQTTVTGPLNSESGTICIGKVAA